MGIDSGHWYTAEGAPFYTVRSRDGTERGVTLRDARRIGAVPSVTTVTQIIAKPQLEAWKVRQGILAALTLPRIDDEAEDDYLARIKTDAGAQARAAADEGSRIHDAIECAFRGQSYPAAYRPHVEATLKEIETLFPTVRDWVPEASFAHESGYGGRVDLHSPSTGIVIDYKGKDGDFSDGKRLAYDQHWQLAAYQHGLTLPRNVCANLFVSRTHPGKVAPYVWSAEAIQEGLDVFQAALALWKVIKRYDASFARKGAAA